MDEVRTRESTQYEKTIEYGLQIQARISKVHNAMENRKDPTVEFTNLITYLNSEILNPIKPKLASIREKYNERIINIRNNPNFPETFSWSRRHKIRYISELLFREHTDYINETIPVIMDRLKELGILGEQREKTTI